MKSIIVFCAAFFLSLASFANNIEVTNVTYNSGAGTVTFNISWENSWRTNTAPNNWDAAWIFIKRKNCNLNYWQHQDVSSTGANHTAAAPLEVQTTPDGKGVFIRRSGNGSGNIASTTITLKLGAVPSPISDWDMQVFGVEMVYIPQSSFQLGDGSSANSFRQGGGSAPTAAFTVASEAAIVYTNTNGNLWSDAYTPTGGSVLAAFPKGFNAMYCMKYEISQGQYADFLNTLAPDQSAARFANANGSIRNTVAGVWPLFSSSAPNRACNYLSFADVCAYNDWSGLAPMSEFEFEKICRGPNAAVANEKAWGTALVTDGNTVVNDALGNEGVSEPVTAGSGLVNCAVTSAAPSGPLRCGFAAKSATTRLEAGATFYGVMEMSGNLYEYVMGVSGAGTNFVGTAHGDGNLQFTPNEGLSDVTGWINQTVTVNQAPGVGATFRGGSYENAALQLNTSDRTYCNNSYGGRTGATGGRGVRRSFN
jgi:formylglycine-generating enzyme required for sulfatase activity